MAGAAAAPVTPGAPATASTLIVESLAEASGQRAVVEAVIAQQVYATAKIDDRVDKFASVEELPQRGTSQVKGQWLEEDENGKPS